MRILILGVTGQDGWYLASDLASTGHEVYGLIRGQRPVLLPEGVKEIRGDLLDQVSLINAVRTSAPDVIYNLAAISSIGVSWNEAEVVSQVTGLGILRLLEAVRQEAPLAHVVQASSADMFGNVSGLATETTPFHPRTPYGVAKLYAHEICQSYREAYKLKVSTAIMYSHTSERQSKDFVVPKVCLAAACIKLGLKNELLIGNLNVRRDWGWAPDFMQAWPLIAAQDHPGDYILSTGVSYTLRDLCRYAFEAVDLEWEHYVKINAAFLRPTDIDVQTGNPSKIKKELGWESEMTFPKMIQHLVEMNLQ